MHILNIPCVKPNPVQLELLPSRSRKQLDSEAEHLGQGCDLSLEGVSLFGKDYDLAFG
jgi:hypothetical protein